MYMPIKLRRKVLRWVPKWWRKHDFELFASLLCVSAGIPLLDGRVPIESLEARLPSYIVWGWALTLTIAPFFIAIGVFRQHHTNELYLRLRAMRLEALGLTMLGWAAIVYAVCILLNFGSSGWVLACITFAFALTCLSRELDIHDKIDEYRLGVGLDDSE